MDRVKPGIGPAGPHDQEEPVGSNPCHPGKQEIGPGGPHEASSLEGESTTETYDDDAVGPSGPGKH